MGEDTQQSLTFVGGNLKEQFLRKINLQQKIPGGIRETAQSLRLGIAVGDVGLDVGNRGTVHQIRATHMKNRTEVRRIFYS